MLTQH